MRREELAVRFSPTRAALGLLTVSIAAVLSSAVASADVNDYFVPNLTTFDYSSVSGTPPYSPLIATGTESWDLYDGTTHEPIVTAGLSGQDTLTQFGSFTNDLLGVNGGIYEGIDHALIDYASFGGGWANEWVDLPIGSDAGISDLLITPLGDFTLFGTFPF